MGILNPDFLVSNITIIGEIISVMILVLFDDFFTVTITFNTADRLKSLILEKARKKFRRKHRIIIKYLFEFAATVIFIAYFVIGYWLLSEYIIVPILIRTQKILLITVIIFFFVTSWMLNNKRARRKYLGYR